MLIPERDNDGKAFPRSLWRTLERQLLQFGGLSRIDDVAGAWEHQGRIYRDSNHQYIVYLESWNDLPAWLKAAHWARRSFRQEALAIEVAGIPEILT